MSAYRIDGISAKKILLPNVTKTNTIHSTFRYPAKFHAPLVRKLVQEFTKPGDRILDPFCGSGTVLLESALEGRSSIGTDIDPIAVFIAKTKSHNYKISHLKETLDIFTNNLQRITRPKVELENLLFFDLIESDFFIEARRQKLFIPAMDNLFHWFKKYVLIDLAKIYQLIDLLDAPETHKDFLRFCFASIIRRASNADPVPVSGLEVTAHMHDLHERGRSINAYALMQATITKTYDAFKSYREALPASVNVKVFQQDARTLKKTQTGLVDCVITSPPYHGAVDYYRRHTLEMFWLGLITDTHHRHALAKSYIGRQNVSIRDEYLQSQLTSDIAIRIERKMAGVSPKRANAFKHYVSSMSKTIEKATSLIRPGGKFIIVVGRSTWQDILLPTDKILYELSYEKLNLVNYFWYPIKNRHMSYSRHNDAKIEHDFVLVMQKPKRKSKRSYNSGRGKRRRDT